MPVFPSLFISHGAPTLAIERSPAQEYLKQLGETLATPRAIIVVSAHHIARGVAVTVDANPETIYDFRGFPEALYEMSYPAPGAPDVAAQIIDQLVDAGFDAAPQTHRGLDHGAWVPLSLMYPRANIPVLQVSIDMSKSPEWHYALGLALAPLRDEGILIIGSGAITHNLRAFFQGDFHLDSDSPKWVTAFADWVAGRIERGDLETVLAAVEVGPFGKQNHPTMDHILPLFVALGAGGSSASGKRLHKSSNYGVLSMDVYGFGNPMQVAAQSRSRGSARGSDHPEDSTKPH